VDRARPGSKHHFVTESAGIPLSTGGNRNDVIALEALLDAAPSVHGRRGRPRRQPDELFGDRAYDHDKYRKKVRQRHPTVHRSPGQPHGFGLGKHRWVVERTIAWYHGMKRLRIRGNAATTSTRPSSAWPPASSPGDTSRLC
jgi:transposase